MNSPATVVSMILERKEKKMSKKQKVIKFLIKWFLMALFIMAMDCFGFITLHNPFVKSVEYSFTPEEFISFMIKVSKEMSQEKWNNIRHLEIEKEK